MYDFVILFFALVGIVLAANIFCNALEHLGEELQVSQGVTGSIFAAVGTALPETIIPILAISNFITIPSGHNDGIGIGAILGAPLMLSTLAFFVMGISLIKSRGINGYVNPEPTGLKRDLIFFLISYLLAFLVGIIHIMLVSQSLNIAVAIILALVYFIYLLLTIKHSKELVCNGEVTQATTKLTLGYLGLKTNYLTILIQLVITLAGLIYFAELFIVSVNNIANSFHISAFILSLVIIPIATELPEKINSVLWLRKGLDTMAVGNITGAMVFQGSLLPIVGILFTKWQITNTLALVSVMITLIATLWLYFNLRRNNLRIWVFLVNGGFYLISLLILLNLK